MSLPLSPHRKELLFLLLVFCLAAAVRFHRLGEESFWIDEVFSTRIARAPFGQILSLIPEDKPPLDYYVQAFVDRLQLGEPETWHRVPAAVFGCVAVVGVYFLALGWFGRRIALLVAVVAAFNPFLLYYSQEARPYSLFAALTVWQQVVLGICLRRARRTHRGGRAGPFLWAGLFSLSLAALYTLYAALLLFASQVVFLLFAPWLERNDDPPQSVAGRLHTFRPLLAFLVLLVIVVAAAWPLRSHARLIPPPDYFWKFQDFDLVRWAGEIAMFFLIRVSRNLWLAVACVALVLLLLGLLEGWRRNAVGITQVALSSVGLIPATLLIFVLINREYTARYCIACVPGFCVLFALGIRFFARKVSLWLRAVGLISRDDSVALLLVCAYAIASVVFYFSGKPYRPDWRGVAHYLAREAQERDHIVVPGGEQKIMIQYYLERYGREALRVLTQADQNTVSDAGAAWMIAISFGEKRRREPFGGIRVERMGALPPAERFESLAQSLGPAPKILVGECSPELLDAGWSQPEHWNRDTVIRYATRLRTGVFLPIREGGPGYLTIRLMPYTYKGAPRQRVRLFIGGRALALRDVPAGRFSEIQWQTPDGVVRPGFNRVELEFAYTHSPSREKKSYGDFRTLAAAVQWIRWEGEAGRAAPTR